MDKQTVGPAFPTEYFYDQETGYERMPAVGMTLRDYFAAKAMQSFLPTSNDDKQIAGWSYLMADAMLKARSI